MWSIKCVVFCNYFVTGGNKKTLEMVVISRV
jgi:hypothetical protein